VRWRYFIAPEIHREGDKVKPATNKDEVLDEILLPLADEFEAGNPRGRTFDPSCPEEFEPLRECVADLLAEQWLAQSGPFKIYTLTPAGYRNFKPRIQALRTLGRL
jgi:hypothetical protein